MSKPSKLRTLENANLICEMLVQGYTLRQIARKLGFQTESHIVEWGNDEGDALFRERYARAMRMRIERMAEEILEISDDSSNDWMGREGLLVPDHENVQRSRLRVDSRKWLLSKLLPRQFGDKVTQELVGDSDRPVVSMIQLIGISPPERREDPAPTPLKVAASR